MPALLPDRARRQSKAHSPGNSAKAAPDSEDEFIYIKRPVIAEDAEWPESGRLFRHSLRIPMQEITELGREAREESPSAMVSQELADVIETNSATNVAVGMSGTSRSAESKSSSERDKTDAGSTEKSQSLQERDSESSERLSRSKVKEGPGGKGERRRFSSEEVAGNKPGVALTPTLEGGPLAKTISLKWLSVSSSVRSIDSPKREKAPPLLRDEPKYKLRICVSEISALPNIQADEISLRASVGSVTLQEIRTGDKPKEESAEEPSVREGPVIKARVEIGSQVERFNLPPAMLNGKEQDMVAMLKVSGLATSLMLQNVNVLKDFLDDEYEADAPFPVQISIEDTSLSLKETFDATPTTDSTLNVCVKSIDIHRGQKIDGINLFSQNQTDGAMELETLRFHSDSEARRHESSPSGGGTRDNESTSSTTSNADLLHTFRSFIEVFESHVKRHGGLKVQLNQPTHIADLLQELQLSLSEEEESDLGRSREDNSSEAPPSYLESVGERTPTLQRPSSTYDTQADEMRLRTLSSPGRLSRLKLRKLQQDSTELKRLQVENDDLISQLAHTKMLLAERSQDLDEVTSECKKAKDDLVTHKQVLENYQEHIERLLTENADLRMRHHTSSPR